MHTSYLSLAVFALTAAAAPSFPKPNSDPFAGSFPFSAPGSSSVADGDDDSMGNAVPAYMDAMDAVQSAKAGAYYTSQSTSHAAPQMQHTPAPKPEHHAPKVQSEPETEETLPLPDPVANDPVPKNPIPTIPPAPVAPPKSSHQIKPHPTSSAAAEPTPQAPVTVTPEPASTPVKPSSKSLTPSSSDLRPIPTSPFGSFLSKASPKPTHRPMHSMGVHEGHLSSSKFSGTPSSSATPSASATPSSKAGLLGLGKMVDSVPIVGPMLGPLIGG